MTGTPAKPRYAFAEFVLSPSRRVLLRRGEEVPLVARYFDLLLLLVERRHEALHRRDIMEIVWSDVVVSDGALSQAVRTLRRALGDDPREPVFIRTLSRHGYRFVHEAVAEQDDAQPLPDSAPAREEAAEREDPFEKELARLLDPGELSGDGGDGRREAAERLHALGTEETLRRLDARPGHEAARALLRDTRWDVPGAGPVPMLGQPGGLKALRILAAERLRRAARLAGSRWGAASSGGAAAGAVGGLLGGSLMWFASPDAVSARVLMTFVLVGAAIGGLGAAGVGAGLAVAEAVARSLRGLALVAMGSLGGGFIGLVAHSLGRWTFEGIFGHDLSPVGGAFEGLALGAAAGLGYALTTPRPGGGGMATPRGAARIRTAFVTGFCCALAALAVTRAGGHLGGVSLDYIARSFQGSQVGLRPLAHLFGELDLGPRTRAILASYEGFLFGGGLILGLTRRPRARS